MSNPRRKHNRRLAVRRKPRHSTKATCIAYENGVGRQVVVSLLDLSLFGAGLAVAEPLPVGSEVAIGLQTIGKPRPPVVAARVMWCGPVAEGGYRIGAQFQQHLPSTMLRALCDS